MRGPPTKIALRDALPALHELSSFQLQRKHLQTLDLGAEQQMGLELRPVHDQTV
jgi:hypothetical protein